MLELKVYSVKKRKTMSLEKEVVPLLPSFSSSKILSRQTTARSTSTPLMTTSLAKKNSLHSRRIVLSPIPQ